MLVPFLEHQHKGRPPHRVKLQKFPFRIGRSPRADHTIYSQEVSTLHAEILREGDDGRVRVVDRSGPGEFIGEVGIATGRPRNAHVVAVDDVTSLTFATGEPDPFFGRGEQNQLLPRRKLSSGDEIDARVSTRIDVSDFVDHKIRATAAHRTQYPIDPTLFPRDILQEMFGVEYFIRVLPERELRTSLLEDEGGDVKIQSPRAR